MKTKEKTKSKTEIATTEPERPTSNSRRRFLAHSGMYTAGLFGSALLGACSDDDSVASSSDNGGNNNNVYIGGPPDEAILNFALNLEYLEAEYYLLGVTGNGLRDKDRGDDPGMVTKPGQTQVDFGDNKLLKQYAAEIAADELHHVQFLRKALGKHAASAPAIDLKNSFAALGNLIGVSNFNPFENATNFLLGAFIFEDVGVTAYHGGSPFIKNRTYLDAAAGILAVEAYHAGLLRTLLTAQQKDQITNLVGKISDVRDQVDGNSDVAADYKNGQPPVAADDDQGIDIGMVEIYGSNYDATNIVPTNDNGIAYNRSIAQIHNVVYATAEKTGKGGFFPDGTNIPGYKDLSMSADNS